MRDDYRQGLLRPRPLGLSGCTRTNMQWYGGQESNLLPRCYEHPALSLSFLRMVWRVSADLTTSRFQGGNSAVELPPVINYFSSAYQSPHKWTSKVFSSSPQRKINSMFTSSPSIRFNS